MDDKSVFDDRLREVDASGEGGPKGNFTLRKIDLVELPPLEEELIEPDGTSGGGGGNSSCTCNTVCTCVPVSTCACNQVCTCNTVDSCVAYSSGGGGGGGGGTGGYYAPCH